MNSSGEETRRDETWADNFLCAQVSLSHRCFCLKNIEQAMGASKCETETNRQEEGKWEPEETHACLMTA